MANYTKLITKQLVITPLITNVSYVTGKQIGSVQHFSKVPLQPNEFLNLLNIQISDKSKNALPIDFFFFKRNPTSAPGDNQVLDFSAQDMDSCIGVGSVISCDYNTTTNRGFANAQQQCPMQIITIDN
jgi:hypothetical protein